MCWWDSVKVCELQERHSRWEPHPGSNSLISSGCTRSPHRSFFSPSCCQSAPHHFWALQMAKMWRNMGSLWVMCFKCQIIRLWSWKPVFKVKFPHIVKNKAANLLPETASYQWNYQMQMACWSYSEKNKCFRSRLHIEKIYILLPEEQCRKNTDIPYSVGCHAAMKLLSPLQWQGHTLGWAEGLQLALTGTLLEKLLLSSNRLFHMAVQPVQKEWKSPPNTHSWKVLQSEGLPNFRVLPRHPTSACPARRNILWDCAWLLGLLVC